MSGRVVQLERGQIKNVVAAGVDATVTTPAFCSDGHNACIIYFNITGTGAWTIKVQGAKTMSGTYMDAYDNNANALSTGSISADQCRLFIGMPKFFKFVATEDTTGATIELDYELLTV